MISTKLTTPKCTYINTYLTKEEFQFLEIDEKSGTFTDNERLNYFVVNALGSFLALDKIGDLSIQAIATSGTDKRILKQLKDNAPEEDRPFIPDFGSVKTKIVTTAPGEESPKENPEIIVTRLFEETENIRVETKMRFQNASQFVSFVNAKGSDGIEAYVYRDEYFVNMCYPDKEKATAAAMFGLEYGGKSITALQFAVAKEHGTKIPFKDQKKEVRED